MNYLLDVPQKCSVMTSRSLRKCTPGTMSTAHEHMRGLRPPPAPPFLFYGRVGHQGWGLFAWLLRVCGHEACQIVVNYFYYNFPFCVCSPTWLETRLVEGLWVVLGALCSVLWVVVLPLVSVHTPVGPSRHLQPYFVTPLRRVLLFYTQVYTCRQWRLQDSLQGGFHGGADLIINSYWVKIL